MTTTKSFFSLYKNSLLRIKGISIIFALLTFIIFPLQGYFEMVRYADGGKFSNYKYQLPTITLAFLPVLLSLFAILLPIIALSFMHKKEASILFHSLPVSRTKILLANFLSTLSVYVVVVLLSNLVYMIMNLGEYGEEKIIQHQLMFFATLTSGLLIIAITFLCSALASTSFDAFFFTGFMCFATLLVYILHEFLMSEYVEGYVIEYNIFLICSAPIINIYNTVFGFDAFGLFGIDLAEAPAQVASWIYIPVAIIILVLACFVYEKRKTEFAQNSNISSILYKIVIITSIYCFTIMAVMISGQLNDYFFISCVFYTVAIGLCLCAVMRRNFKPNKNVYMTIGISLVISLAYLSAMVYTSWFGSDKYIPNPSEVKSVTVAGRFLSGDIYYGNSYERLGFTDKENIELATKIHAFAMENDSDVVASDSMYEGFSSSYTTISYTLKNGIVVTRAYDVIVQEEFTDMNIELYGSVENFNNIYEETKNKLAVCEKVTLTTPFVENYTTSQKEDVVNKIKEAVLLDIKANSIEKFYTQGNDIYSVIDFEPKFDPERPNRGDNSNYSYYVTKNSMNTIKVLKELGYKDYAKRALTFDKVIYKLDIKPHVNNDYSSGITGITSSNWYNIERIVNYTNIEVIDDVKEVNELLDKAQIYTNEIKDLSVILVVNDEMNAKNNFDFQNFAYENDYVYSYFIEE